MLPQVSGQFMLDLITRIIMIMMMMMIIGITIIIIIIIIITIIKTIMIKRTPAN